MNFGVYVKFNMENYSILNVIGFLVKKNIKILEMYIVVLDQHVM